ncbi:MAG: MoxR family ATPase [Oscillospiraceae bacterium]|nr:MoxR family ATPase [Oscillospiraceae bacterium]
MNREIEALIQSIEKVIVGKRNVIKLVLSALLCEGHILIEDVPGVGKTQLIAALAKSLEGKFNRIQMTPDIMPSDILGFSMLNSITQTFEYKPGAAVCNFLLADEINRASPKAQSSLLEVMEEGQISLDGFTHKLPVPFMVMATQNPVETYGTYHLPEAQMDRFFMKVSMGYPNSAEELMILERTQYQNPLSAITCPALSLTDVARLINETKKVAVVDSVKQYIISLVNATRNNDNISLAVSPRGSISLYKASKAIAYINDRNYVTPDDVKEIAVSVMAHRIILSSKGKTKYESAAQLVDQILSTVPVPMQ